MIDHGIGAIPVVDAGDVLVGIISYIDVLRALPLDATTPPQSDRGSAS